MLCCGRHVRHCALNRTGDVYVPKQEWARVITGQRRDELAKYWARLAREVREKLASDGSVLQIFSDLGLPSPG